MLTESANATASNRSKILCQSHQKETVMHVHGVRL